VPTNDPQYDLGKDVVNSNLVSLGESADNVIDEEEPQRIEVTLLKIFF